MQLLVPEYKVTASVGAPKQILKLIIHDALKTRLSTLYPEICMESNVHEQRIPLAYDLRISRYGKDDPQPNVPTSRAMSNGWRRCSLPGGFLPHCGTDCPRDSAVVCKISLHFWHCYFLHCREGFDVILAIFESHRMDVNAASTCEEIGDFCSYWHSGCLSQAWALRVNPEVLKQAYCSQVCHS